MESKDGHRLLIRGESVGGGRARIRQINEIEVEFTGEYSTMIVGYLDRAGPIDYITKCLADHKINVATFKLFREEKGKNAFRVIESDSSISDEVKEKILQYESINSINLIEI